MPPHRHVEIRRAESAGDRVHGMRSWVSVATPGPGGVKKMCLSDVSPEGCATAKWWRDRCS